MVGLPSIEEMITIGTLKLLVQKSNNVYDPNNKLYKELYKNINQELLKIKQNSDEK